MMNTRPVLCDKHPRVHGVGRFLQHFHSIVPDENGCMVWPLSKRGRYGYGQAACFESIHLAHRVAAHLFLGLELEDSATCVLHRCDNPPCINPDHLFFGTLTDNAADRDAKGRTARGIQRPNAKLTPTAVHDIRARLRAGEPVASVATSYGVCRASIRNVREGRTWRHVQSGAIT